MSDFDLGFDPSEEDNEPKINEDDFQKETFKERCKRLVADGIDLYSDPVYRKLWNAKYETPGGFDNGLTDMMWEFEAFFPRTLRPQVAKFVKTLNPDDQKLSLENKKAIRERIRVKGSKYPLSATDHGLKGKTYEWLGDE